MSTSKSREPVASSTRLWIPERYEIVSRRSNFHESCDIAENLGGKLISLGELIRKGGVDPEIFDRLQSNSFFLGGIAPNLEIGANRIDYKTGVLSHVPYQEKLGVPEDEMAHVIRNNGRLFVTVVDANSNGNRFWVDARVPMVEERIFVLDVKSKGSRTVRAGPEVVEQIVGAGGRANVYRAVSAVVVVFPEEAGRGNAARSALRD
ncbi:MAG: hypothetical protein KGH64_00970 [Candidatus Micrarchaeota archaeon]|nr:hypothetical protein [Candidatus Micrarchaeota archaeon]MDE1833888.1 hypothetical protein [Candidatus Micrarchaeota archaeon]MDE1859965.1 hypothetical protein [Candidatus Micrarchaeota archaeon]